MKTLGILDIQKYRTCLVGFKQPDGFLYHQDRLKLTSHGNYNQTRELIGAQQSYVN
jgi:hypothetical protein